MNDATLYSRLNRGCTALVLVFSLGLLSILAVGPANAQITYVDIDATGANNGSSWTDAYTSLHTALGSAAAGDSVWVAEGTYYPDEGMNATQGSEFESFSIPDSVAVYGGFSGGETSLSGRNVTANRTILSGDIDQDDNDPDGDGLVQLADTVGTNSYHVVYGATIGGRLDGFYMTAGDASGQLEDRRGGGLYVPTQTGADAAMTVARTRFIGNHALRSGGGVSVDNANVVLSNVEFIGNVATNEDGGGLHVTAADYGQIWMANVVFSGNTAGRNGGAFDQDDGNTMVNMVTVTGNDAAMNGGGLYIGTNAGMSLQNTTVWGNTAGMGPQIFVDNSLNIALSILEGDTTAVGGAGFISSSEVLDADPLFLNSAGSDGTVGTPDDDLRVNWASPGIDPTFQQNEVSVSDSADVDNDGDASEPLPIDLAGEDRLKGRSVDMGVYEGGSRPQGTSVVYADSASGTDTGQSGGSWSNPYRTLQAALDAARNADAAGGVPFGEVWVAQGTYFPDQGPGITAGDSSRTFALVDSVAVYGGFQNGDSFTQRNSDPATNGTVLSGDIGVRADTSDNSGTVVSGGLKYFGSLSPVTTLDGFTVTGGTATGMGQELGGGIFIVGFNNQTLSPTLRNLRVVENYAVSGAGMFLSADSASTLRPRLSKIDVIGNEASNVAGGMVLTANQGTLSPRLANVRVLGNEAQAGAALGVNAAAGGTTTPTIANLVVSGNTSAADSTAALFRSVNGTLDPLLVNTTWANNRAGADSLSALIDVRGNSSGTSVRIANSILWGNADRALVSGLTGTVRVDSSIVEDGWGGTGSGNATSHPLYVNASGPDGVAGTSDDSLQVLATSPALNHGGASLLPSDATDLDADGDRSERLPQDLAGNARVQDGSVDAGAYEGAYGSVPTITFTNPDTPPSPGTATSIDITFPTDFGPTGGTFFYRPAGASSFESTTLDLAGEPGVESTVTVEIPGAAVTKRGTQYFLRVRGYRTGGSDPIQFTVPTSAPIRTGFLPVQVEQMTAKGSAESERYRMLSVPAALGDRSVFDVLEAQYGTYSPSKWRLARWSPADSAYAFGSEVDSLRPGDAAWLVVRSGDSLTVEGAQSSDASGPKSIPLDPGWNQIGSPFPFPVAWADVSRPASVRPPAAYDATRPQGQRYQFDAPTLEPWRGAFVYNAADSTVTIQIPPIDTSDATSTAQAKDRSLAKAGGAVEYRLQASATLYHDDKRLQDRSLWLGFAESADQGFGSKDLAKPPRVGPHVGLHAVSEDGPALARSLKPPTSDGRAWTIQVGVDLEERLRSPKEVSVRFAEQGSRPDGFERYVFDVEEGRRLPLVDQSVKVRVTPDDPSRRLRVVVGTKSFAQAHSDGAPLTIDKTKLRSNAPNPFTESTTISYQLAEEENVTISVYDVLGRKVHTLVDGTREPGVHQTRWQAEGPGGRELASGVYFCRMQAGSYTATKKITLVR